MIRYARHIPSLAAMLLALAALVWMWHWLLEAPALRRSAVKAVAATLGLFLTAAVIVAGFSLGFTQVVMALPPGVWIAWLRAAALSAAALSLASFVALWLRRQSPRFDRSRRRVLRTASAAVLAAPVLAGGFGSYVERTRLKTREVDVEVEDLPKDLDGLRLIQLTDMHLGPFLDRKELARAVDMANEFRPHLGMITGDLITDRGDPLDECLEELARLRASDGVYGCLGNHEGYVRAEGYAQWRGRRLGIDFLRQEAHAVPFGNTHVNVSGVDHQPMGRPYLVNCEHLRSEGGFNILLSHNPDVFPTAAAHGHDLILAGHTHGGQLALDVLGYSVNVLRLFTPYIRGLYRHGRSAIYVSRGIGTVGIPVRIGVPPEVSLLRLVAKINREGGTQ